MDDADMTSIGLIRARDSFPTIAIAWVVVKDTVGAIVKGSCDITTLVPRAIAGSDRIAPTVSAMKWARAGSRVWVTPNPPAIHSSWATSHRCAG